MRKNNGFTLIEVLIALIIIAIALTAVIEATTASTRATIRTRDVMSAHWVGMNIISEIQTGIMKMPEADSPVQGESSMLGKEWHWEVSAKSSLENRSMFEVTVKVENARYQLINTVVGYAHK